jgi:uncharacterized membrane protein YeiH
MLPLYDENTGKAAKHSGGYGGGTIRDSVNATTPVTDTKIHDQYVMTMLAVDESNVSTVVNKEVVSTTPISQITSSAQVTQGMQSYLPLIITGLLIYYLWTN